MTSIQTVLGKVDPVEVGKVMFHEHILFDLVPPHSTGNRDRTITMEDRWQIDYLSNRYAANAHQLDIEVAIGEIHAYAQDGGSLIVDQSAMGLDRHPQGLKAVSQCTEVHIVASTGTYTLHYLDPALLKLDQFELGRLFVEELQRGMDGTTIRAGLIGEIGCSWPLETFERRALAAAAIAQRTTGAAISVHPGMHRDACSEILHILSENGAELDRVILCHMDRTLPDGKGVRALLQAGVNVEWPKFNVKKNYELILRYLRPQIRIRTPHF